MNRELAKKKAQSRDCHCINGEDRDSNFNSVIDEVFDYFENKVNNGVLDGVNHQRGLLESFRDWHNNTKIADNNIHNGDLDDFLEDYNCG